jgi:hypothetical protein
MRWRGGTVVTIPSPTEEIPEDAEELYEVDENGNVVPVIRYEDDLIHTDEHPNCDDPDCPCNQGS